MKRRLNSQTVRSTAAYREHSCKSQPVISRHNLDVYVRACACVSGVQLPELLFIAFYSLTDYLAFSLSFLLLVFVQNITHGVINARYSFTADKS